MTEREVLDSESVEVVALVKPGLDGLVQSIDVKKRKYFSFKGDV